MARPHHTPAWKPWEQTDHPSVRLLWWEFVTYSPFFTSWFGTFRLKMSLLFFLVPCRWMPNQIWECKCLAILHQSVWYVNSCSSKYWTGNFGFHVIFTADHNFQWHSDIQSKSQNAFWTLLKTEHIYLKICKKHKDDQKNQQELVKKKNYKTMVRKLPHDKKARSKQENNQIVR